MREEQQNILDEKFKREAENNFPTRTYKWGDEAPACQVENHDTFIRGCRFGFKTAYQQMLTPEQAYEIARHFYTLGRDEKVKSQMQGEYIDTFKEKIDAELNHHLKNNK